VYPADVAMIFPVAGRGRPRKRHVPDVASIAAQAMLVDMPGVVFMPIANEPEPSRVLGHLVAF